MEWFESTQGVYEGRKVESPPAPSYLPLRCVTPTYYTLCNPRPSGFRSYYLSLNTTAASYPLVLVKVFLHLHAILHDLLNLNRFTFPSTEQDPSTFLSMGPGPPVVRPPGVPKLLSTTPTVDLSLTHSSLYSQPSFRLWSDVCPLTRT